MKGTYSRLWYKDDKQAIAKKMGYNSFFEAIACEYEKLKSLSRVGDLFDVTWPTIRYHLKKMDVPINGRGGRNNVGDSKNKE